MSVSKWAYSPEKCDGDFCPGCCDVCGKRWDVDEEENDSEEEKGMEKERREFIFECEDVEYGEEMAKQYPTAELIRCRNCKFAERRSLEKVWCFNHAITMDQAGFCSEGKREDSPWLTT